MQHPGGAPVNQWLLGNQLLRKIKIKLGNLHFLDYIGYIFPLRFGHKLLYSSQTHVATEKKGPRDPMTHANESCIRQEICRIGRMLHERSYVAGCDGNISVR